MRPDLVVDVGNSRIKWGRCLEDRVVESVSLPGDDTLAWQLQLERWNLTESRSWVVAGVHPKRRDALVEWLRTKGQQTTILAEPHRLTLAVLLERPERVGIDRLLNAVAANRRRPAHMSVVLVDAGSAVTVDWLNEDGAFCGGAIFPGVRLMAQALHGYTALLPLVELRSARPLLPGKSTPAAIEAGIYWAVAGGIKSLIAELTAGGSRPCRTFLTGGDALLLARALDEDVIVWPDMTLEGIRLAAEALP